MIHALFDPEIFFASNAVWDCPTSRTEFLDRLDKHLEFIDSIGVAHILWCNEFEERLWSQPHLPPWKNTKEWDMRMSMIFYQKLTKYGLKLDISQLAPGECKPKVQCHCPIAYQAFLKLVTAIFINALTPHYCPSIRNITDNDHRFRPNTAAQWSKFLEVRIPQDWPKKIMPVQLFWPSSRNENDRFRKCIELVALSKDISPSQFQRFSFMPYFLDDIVSASRRERIADRIVKRLTLSAQEAARDNQLRDEELPSGERRFRVTSRPSSLRIHYEIQNGEIVFKRFYDEGQHDVGLRH